MINLFVEIVLHYYRTAYIILHSLSFFDHIHMWPESGLGYVCVFVCLVGIFLFFVCLVFYLILFGLLFKCGCEKISFMRKDATRHSPLLIFNNGGVLHFCSLWLFVILIPPVCVCVWEREWRIDKISALACERVHACWLLSVIYSWRWHPTWTLTHQNSFF